MPADLSYDQLLKLMPYLSPQGMGGAGGMPADGFSPSYSLADAGRGNYGDGGGGGESYDPNKTVFGKTNADNDKMNDIWGKDGKFLGTTEKNTAWGQELQFLAMVAALYGGGQLAAGALGGGAGAAGAAEGAAGAANGMWDVLPEAMSGGGIGSVAGPSAGGLAGAAGAGESAGALGALGEATTTTEAVGSGLFGGGASSWLGPAATLLGAAAGAAGKPGTESNTNKTMDPALRPYVFGDGKNPGLFDYQAELLKKQYGPNGYGPGFDAMRGAGQGLFTRPIADNGFSRFFPGK